MSSTYVQKVLQTFRITNVADNGIETQSETKRHIVCVFSPFRMLNPVCHFYTPPYWHFYTGRIQLTDQQSCNGLHLAHITEHDKS